MVTAVRNNSGLVFGCSCPGCGAELEFRESLWVTTCSHCDTRLRIVLPEGVAAWVARPAKPLTQIRFLIDRHFKSNGLNPPGSDLQLKQLYYPYWKIDASLLKVRTLRETRIYANEADPSSDIEETNVSRAVTLSPYMSALSAGPVSADIPDTLGFRAGYLKLYPFAAPYRDMDFDVAPVIRSTTTIAERVQKSLSGLDSLEMTEPSAASTRLLHAKFSLLYFPYVIGETYRGDARRVVVDGISGRVVADSLRSTEGESTAETIPLATDAGAVYVEPHRCGVCGNAFAGDRSLVYQCQNCGEWTMLAGCARAITTVESWPGNSGDTFFPFWAFQISEVQRDSFARTLGLMQSAKWIVVPAFATPNLEAAGRLAKRITGSSLLTDECRPAGDHFDFQPVTVEPDQAAAMADMVLLRSAVEKQVPVAGLHLEPTTVRLVCLPFHPESYFWVDSLLGAVTVERAAVAGR